MGSMFRKMSYSITESTGSPQGLLLVTEAKYISYSSDTLQCWPRWNSVMMECKRAKTCLLVVFTPFGRQKAHFLSQRAFPETPPHSQHPLPLV